MDDDRLATRVSDIITSDDVVQTGAGCAGFGPEATFTAFYRVEISKLVGFVMKAVGANHDDAADAAQIALTKAWESWDTLTNPRAWVRTVATRQFYRLISSREIPTDELPDRPGLVTPDTRLELSERTEAVRRLLDTLPRTQRVVLAWFTDGFSTDEIADELGMSHAATRQNLHRARKALKKRLVTGREGSEA